MPLHFWSRFWTLVLLFGLFVVSLGLAAAATGWQEAIAAFGRIGRLELLALLGLSVVNYVIRAVRWSILTRTVGVGGGIAQEFRHYFGGLAFMATPGRLGEFVRLRWLSREAGVPVHRVLPAAIAERAFDLASVGLLLVLSLALSAFGPGYIWLLAVVALSLAWIASNSRLLQAIVTFAWRAVGRLPRVFARARLMAKGIGIFTRPGAGVPILLIGGLGWFCEGWAFALLLDWMGAPLPLWAAVAIFLTSMTSGALAGMPGGLGGAEAAMVALLLFADVPAEIALPATALIRAVTMWFAILVGLIVFPFAEAKSKSHAILPARDNRVRKQS
ncbi:MAG: YbhN family protein [Paracoccaceae bacterium]